jgi:hypothetical protein
VARSHRRCRDDFESGLLASGGLEQARHLRIGYAMRRRADLAREVLVGFYHRRAARGSFGRCLA